MEVSAICFGGAHFGKIQDDTEAIRLLHEAIDAGMTFLDNAWEYNGGRSEELMGKGLQGRRQEACSCRRSVRMAGTRKWPCSNSRNRSDASRPIIWICGRSIK